MIISDKNWNQSNNAASFLIFGMQRTDGLLSADGRNRRRIEKQAAQDCVVAADMIHPDTHGLPAGVNRIRSPGKIRVNTGRCDQLPAFQIEQFDRLSPALAVEIHKVKRKLVFGGLFERDVHHETLLAGDGIAAVEHAATARLAIRRALSQSPGVHRCGPSTRTASAMDDASYIGGKPDAILARAFAKQNAAVVSIFSAPVAAGGAVLFHKRRGKLIRHIGKRRRLS